jgi:hypothetical protein
MVFSAPQNRYDSSSGFGTLAERLHFLPDDSYTATAALGLFGGTFLFQKESEGWKETKLNLPEPTG